MRSRLEVKLTICLGLGLLFFFVSTLHLFQHVSSPHHHEKHLDEMKNKFQLSKEEEGEDVQNTLDHNTTTKRNRSNHKKNIVSQISFNYDNYNSDGNTLQHQKIPFPQSINNEDWETINHPAIDMLPDFQIQKKEFEQLKVPSFWNPPLSSIKDDGEEANAKDEEIDIRTFLGNYGERLITPQEAKLIGSYTKKAKDYDDQEAMISTEEEKTGDDKYVNVVKSVSYVAPPDETMLETIYVSISSYRDYRCPKTIRKLFTQATYPERIRVGIVDQTDLNGEVREGGEDEDSGENGEKIVCGRPRRNCSEHPDDIFCKYSHLIDIHVMDAEMAVGPVFARHIGHRMYRGEYFAMQTDAHMEFVEGWDVDVIEQWKSAKNEMAVLSTYVSDVDDHYDDATGKCISKSVPKMCNTDFDTDFAEKYLNIIMHGQQPEGEPEVIGEPTLHPFWAAGFSFARGHFVVQVPYDQYLPMIFQGEEIIIGLRGFTYGYDYYAPERSVLFHYYSSAPGRSKVKKFWEHQKAYKGVEEASRARLLAISELLPIDERKNGKEEKSGEIMENEEQVKTEEENQGDGGGNEDEEKNNTDIEYVSWEMEWNGIEAKEYGMGKVRTLKKFFDTFGINLVERKVEHHLCRFVGERINAKFLPHMRKDGMGIDYDSISYKFKDPEVYGEIWLNETISVVQPLNFVDKENK